MIRFEEIGPATFYTTDAAWEYRSRMGGRVFVPDPANGEVYWFPVSMTPSAILTHRLTAGLSGNLGDGREHPTRYPRPPSRKERILRFEMTPEAWVNDSAMAVDPDGRDTHILVNESEARELTGYTEADWDNLDNGDADDLRTASTAPRWMAEWDGPFTIDFLAEESD